MDQTVTKSIFQIVGNAICVEASDGVKVSSVLSGFIKQKKNVNISFQNVSMLSSPFLNTAIGVLYKDFKEEEIKEYLHVKEISDTDARLLKRVVDNAKIFYSDPDRIKNSIKEVLEES